MKMTKMKGPMKLSLLGLVFVSFSVVLSACEDFVRFRTEKYTCDTNRLGLYSIELETQRGTTIATLLTEQGPQALEKRDVVVHRRRIVFQEHRRRTPPLCRRSIDGTSQDA